MCLIKLSYMLLIVWQLFDVILFYFIEKYISDKLNSEVSPMVECPLIVIWIIGSIPQLTNGAISWVSQCSRTSVTCFGMYCPVCGMMCITYLLLLIRKSSPWSGGSRFFLLLSKWTITICPMPYIDKYNVLSASLNKTFSSWERERNVLFNDALNTFYLRL